MQVYKLLEKLNNCENVCDDSLVDIEDIKIDREKSIKEKVLNYLETLNNPYSFKCGNIKVNMKYSEKGKSLENCIINIINQKNLKTG